MAGTYKRTVGPVALSATLTTNIYNNTSALIYDLVRHMHIANKTGTAATFTLYLGATGANAAGTELALAKNVPANDYVDLYWPAGLKMVSTDFLVGGSGTATALTFVMFGEQFVV